MKKFITFITFIAIITIGIPVIANDSILNQTTVKMQNILRIQSLQEVILSEQCQKEFQKFIIESKVTNFQEWINKLETINTLKLIVIDTMKD